MAGFNLNWDASWQVRTRSRASFGWSAEFAIPFRTLRYARGGRPDLGPQLPAQHPAAQRDRLLGAAAAAVQPLPRVAWPGTVRGLEVPGQRNLKLTPYALAGRRAATSWRRTPALGPPTLGGDLKYSLTPSLTLDATVNTDFAQVEVDEQQMNLDRFNLFFPEKRPFFLENAGLFTVGTPGEVELFFSRRIGIGPSGEVIPILAGGRLSGKVARRQRGPAGHADARCVRDGGGRPPTTSGAAREPGPAEPLERGRASSSTARPPATSRAPRDHNRTYGVDGRWGIGRYLQLVGLRGAHARRPGITRDDHAFNLGATYLSPSWDIYGKYTEVGEGFNPEVGFLARQGFRKPELPRLPRAPDERLAGPARDPPARVLPRLLEAGRLPGVGLRSTSTTTGSAGAATRSTPG